MTNVPPKAPAPSETPAKARIRGILRGFAFILGLAAWSAALPPSPAVAANFESAAPYAILMDAESGRILFGRNIHEPVPPASMSKIMTLIMAFDAIKRGEWSLKDTVLVSENAWRAGGAASGSSTMFLEPGSRPPLSAVISGVAVQSGNDASIVIAEALSGSEAVFAQDMNEKAKDIGLKQSVFTNATGWPHPEHRMSVHDIALASRYTIRNHPEFYSFYRGESFKWNGIVQPNRNALLGRNGVDGLKTGYTKEAGYGLAASAIRDDFRLIVVVAGLDSIRARSEEATKLLDWGFRVFSRHVVADDRGIVAQADAWACGPEKIGLKAESSITVPVLRRDIDRMVVEAVYEAPIQAPVARGDVVARLHIAPPGEEPFSFPLHAAEDLVNPAPFACLRSKAYHALWGRFFH